MYFNANLSIDPAQLTKIEKVKPQKAFKRILYFLTFGSVTDQEEHETFTAVSILQQLHGVFSGLGINNLVRLSHDDIDFYLDSDGKKDDLKETLDLYDLKINDAMSERFKKLNMVLEHEQNGFKFLINITINRTHSVGIYPIDIFIDGLLQDFSAQSESDADAIKLKMQDIFKDQSSYESYVSMKQAVFNQFIDNIKFQIQKMIRVTDLRQESKSNILIPKEAKEDVHAFKQNYPVNSHVNSPVYHGYYGFGDSFYYAFLWSSMCHSNHIHVHNTNLVSEQGSVMKEIGNDGIDAGDNSLFDCNEDYNSRLQENNLSYDDSSDSYSEAGDSSSDSWWGGDFSDSSSDSSGGDSSCSSCSSCGGCGGGD